jgi:alkyl hydroperoxide reductase subunit AhpF
MEVDNFFNEPDSEKVKGEKYCPHCGGIL